MVSHAPGREDEGSNDLTHSLCQAKRAEYGPIDPARARGYRKCSMIDRVLRTSRAVIETSNREPRIPDRDPRDLGVTVVQGARSIVPIQGR